MSDITVGVTAKVAEVESSPDIVCGNVPVIADTDEALVWVEAGI